MKTVRVLLVGLAVVLALLLLAFGLALNASVQTWVVHRLLASHPQVPVQIGRVSAGWSTVEVSDLQVTADGIDLSAPKVTARLNLLAALVRHDYRVAALEARDWTLVVHRHVEVAPAGPATRLGTAPSATRPAATPPGFAGVFPRLRLPADVSLGTVELAGQVLLPGRRGPARVRISGGGFSAGAVGRLAVVTDLDLRSGRVGHLHGEGEAAVTMDTPRSFTDATLTFSAVASGGRLAKPVTLRGQASATRRGEREHYTMTCRREERSLLEVAADFPLPAGPITGAWKIDLTDADVAPFALGRELPTFAAAGQGRFDTAPSFAHVHALGTLSGAVDHLAVLFPNLAAIGPVDLTADVDLGLANGTLTVSRLDAAVATRPAGSVTQASPVTERPVATLRALQAFDFTAASREVKPTDPAKDLFAIDLRGVPLGWARPFVAGYTFSGGDLTGEVLASPRAGGLTFRAKSPLAAHLAQLSRGGRPLLRDVDLSFRVAGDCTPQGWQAELADVTARTGARTWLQLDARAGQLAGPDQAMKATGRLTVDLAAASAQPLFGHAVAVSAGEASVDFAGSWGAKTQLQAQVAVRKLAAVGSAEPLPAVRATLRADWSEDGRIEFALPLALERLGRTTDATLSGTLSSRAPGGAFNLVLTSDQLIVDDALSLRAVVAGNASSSAGAAPPFWATLAGQVALQLKKVVYLGTAEFGNVTGTVRFAGGAVTLEQARAAVNEGGEGRANLAIAYRPGTDAPYAFQADLALSDVDAGPLFVALALPPGPTAEGKFTVTAKLAGSGATLADAAVGAGRYELTSRGGVFRGLPVNVGNLVENSSKLASWLASAGNAITSLAGRKDVEEVPTRSQAASDLAKILSSIAYDQLGLVIARDEHRNVRINEFTLIAPEVRLTGSGATTHVAGRRSIDDPVTFEYRIRARGRPAELMKYLGVLDPTPDTLGYAACTIPVRVEGTLARLDTTELSNRLVALAVEKTGLTEKAVDWINRLRGKSTN